MAKGISLPVVQSGLEASIQQGVKNVGKINIPATIDPSAFKNLAQPLGRVSGLATEFEKSIAASNARVLAFGASVGIINGVQNAFADLVRTGIEVQKTLADIAAISGKGGDELSKFGDALFDVGRATGQTFKTAAQAALEFSRQGLSVEETLKRTTDALTLTRFTTLNAAEAVDVLTAAANSFGETGITTAQIINKLVAVDTKFAVSAEDLANGLARAGSIAQEVGVNFDELNAAITVAQERTARGGAVIGNALKTIFTRIRSDETVQALRDIGVESLNAQGQLKGAIPLLQEVAQKIQGLSGGERVQVLEAVASKYNINILSALLDDLNNANSKFTQAVGISAGASNQAYERQIELNKTLSAQINNVTVSVSQLFNKLAEIGVTENLNTLLKFVSDLVSGFNKLLDSESVGGNIAKGLIKGISDVFFTVGLPIIGAIFIKLTRDIAQFGIESLKTILGINQQVRERQALEQAVVNTLIQDQQVMASILSLSGNRAKQEEYLLSVYNRQLNALQQVKNIASSVTPALMAGGLTATSGRIERRGAGGYLPAQEAADIRRGVGGASPSSKVVSIPNFAFGGGKRGTMIANTSEYIVPNFANGGSAIFNKDMARAYGLPAGARKIAAAGGYVPNFAEQQPTTYYTAKPQWIGALAQAGLPSTFSSKKRGNTKADVDAFLNSKGLTLSDVFGIEKVMGGKIEGSKSQFNIANATAAMLLPNAAEAAEANRLGSIGVAPSKDFLKTANLVKFSAFGLQTSSAIGQQQVPDIEGKIKKAILSEAFSIVNQFTPIQGKEPFSPSAFEQFFLKKGGAAGAVAAAAGATFESAVDYAFNPSEAESGIKSGNTLDVQNLSPTLRKAFGGIPSNITKADYKISAGQVKKFANQVLANKSYSLAGASGYIPNFAAGSPLGDAINREMAAGVSPSKIRITQDGRLRNSGNPSGLAVINTRDEPNGKIPNFASPSDIRRAEDRAVKYGRASYITDRPQDRYTGGDTFDYGVGASAAEEGNKKLAESAEKTKVGLDKMFYAMSGITLASSTLETTLKNTNNGLADFAVGLGKAAAAASQGALLGGTIKDFASGYTKSGNKAIAGLAGFASKAALPIAISTAIGGAIIDSVESTQLRNIEDVASDQRGRGSVKDVIESGNIEKISATRKQLLKDLGNTKYDDGFFGFFADKANNAIINEKTAALDAINKKIAEGKKLKTQETEQEKKTIEETQKRIALASVLNAINEKFSIAQNKRDLDRARNQADFIRNSINISEYQKAELELQQKLLEIDNRKIDSIEASRNKVFQQIASASKLATVDKAALESLMKRVESGERLEGIYEELEKLQTQGAINAKEKVQAIISEEKQQQKNLSIEREKLELIGRATIELNNQLKVRELLNKATDTQVARNKRISDAASDLQKQFDIFKEESPVSALERSASAKGFATRQETFNLASAKRNLDIRKQEIEIEYEKKKALKDAEEAVKSEIKTSFELLQGLDPQRKEVLKLSIAYGNLNDAIKTLNEAAQEAMAGGGLANDPRIVSGKAALETAKEAQKEYKFLEERASSIERIRKDSINKGYSREYLLQQMAVDSPIKAGISKMFDELNKESDNFSQTFAYNTTGAFRDGLRDALSAAVSQTDDLGSALQNVAMNFLKTMQSQFLNQAAGNITLAIGKGLGMAKGGLVTGGSGYRDDVPRMLTGGEFVMRKSAVQKYGAANLAKMNNGGIFLPGVRGGGNITGYDQLRAFANQTTTSGATDILRGGASSAFINLEDQSSKLSRFGLLNEDSINQEIRSAQEQGLNIITQREAYRTQQRKAFQQQLVGTIASAALSAGISKLMPKAPYAIGKSWQGAINPNIAATAAYGGMIRRYASGGPTDDVPALLMSGEYIMNRGATSKYGKRLLDSMNQGRAPRFADGGEVGSTTPTTTTESNTKMMGDVSININVTGQNSQTETQGNTNQGGIDYKKMSERIKAVVLETINEEKRLGGALRTR